MFNYELLKKYSKDISILFIEDDFSIRTETKELLEQSGECEDIDELVNSLINDLNVVINYQN